MRGYVAPDPQRHATAINKRKGEGQEGDNEEGTLTALEKNRDNPKPAEKQTKRGRQLGP